MPRAGLTTEIVVEAAAALADEQGMEEVTLVALADRLGVKPPSLYKHVDGLEAIHRAVALKGLREINARIAHAAVGLSKEDALVAIAAACWRFAREHPGLYAATLRVSPSDSPEMQSASAIFVGVVSTVLESFGIKGTESQHAIRAVRAIVHGFVSLDANGSFGTQTNVEESFIGLVRSFAAGLVPSEPNSSTRPFFRIGRFSLGTR